MSSEDQAAAYVEEARLSLDSARVIFQAAREDQSNMWAQVAKNGYDAKEQAISAAIAAKAESIPRQHPAKVTKFLDLYDPGASSATASSSGCVAGVSLSPSLFVGTISTPHTNNSTERTQSASWKRPRSFSGTSRRRWEHQERSKRSKSPGQRTASW